MTPELAHFLDSFFPEKSGFDMVRDWNETAEDQWEVTSGELQRQEMGADKNLTELE